MKVLLMSLRLSYYVKLIKQQKIEDEVKLILVVIIYIWHTVCLEETITAVGVSTSVAVKG